MTKAFDSFAEFYPFYLSEHKNRICRRLHFIGSSLILFVLCLTFIVQLWWLLLLLPLLGYGFAWLGHFWFEKNKPVTFVHPLFSLMADWVMYRDMLIGKITF